jgi:hypothetical protein
LIDLTARSRAVVEGIGPEAAKTLYLTREKRGTRPDRRQALVHGRVKIAG